jgi:chemotaxis signal transduction protein
MMRLALFEVSETPCAVALDKVLHILTGPHVYRLPLLRSCFAGVFVYQGQAVPLLASERHGANNERTNLHPAFVLVCEAEFGLLGVPAEKIVRITKTGEIDSEIFSAGDFQDQVFEMSGRDFRLLDLNQIMEDPDFTITG